MESFYNLICCGRRKDSSKNKIKNFYFDELKSDLKNSYLSKCSFCSNKLNNIKFSARINRTIYSFCQEDCYNDWIRKYN